MLASLLDYELIDVFGKDAGSAGVEGVLVVTTAPDSSSTATTSVNVPPVSMPMRTLTPGHSPG